MNFENNTITVSPYIYHFQSLFSSKHDQGDQGDQGDSDEFRRRDIRGTSIRRPELESMKGMLLLLILL